MARGIALGKSCKQTVVCWTRICDLLILSTFINSFYQVAPRMRLEKSATRFVQQRGGTNLQLAKCELLPNRRPCFSHPAECCVDFATQLGTTHLPNPVQNGQAILYVLSWILQGSRNHDKQSMSSHSL